MIYVDAVLPNQCQNYTGPHTTACLSSIFADSGCLQVGHGNPNNLTSTVEEQIATLNIRYELRVLIPNLVVTFTFSQRR